MRLGLLAALLTLSILPTVAAQAPPPEDVVLLACGTVGGVDPQARDLLPVCPGDPPAPASPDEGAAPPPPAADPLSPEGAQQLADTIVQEASGIPEDPESAPARVLAIVAVVVDFVQRVLQLPGDVGHAIHGGITDAQVAVKGAVSAAAASTADAIGGAIEKVAALFDRPERAPAQFPRAPVRAPVEAPALELPLDRVRELVG